MLPDSTSVWLNSGAEIRYPSVFNKETRDVHISGECFFDVTKDSKRQFIVHTDNLNIKIFGTRFNVKEYNDEKRTEISLVEGKVEVFNKSDRPYTELNPNEQFVLSDRKAAVKRIKNINALIAWTKNIIIFEDEPFEDVIQTLESWYGVDINFEEHMLNNHSYTFKVKTESLREVLDLISVITPIRYEIDGEIVNIKYK